MKVLHVGYGYWPYRYGGLMNYVEDLMDAQVDAGHRVVYFCVGRHYPLLGDDRLYRWSRRGIAMREILNSSLLMGGPGTLRPEADLHHPPSERNFRTVLEEVGPDIVHIHELVGLPSSIIDLTRAAGTPVLATLQDYGPLCPVHVLYDIDGQLCLRDDVGAQCARCCAAAPTDRHRLFGKTGAYELRRRLPSRAGDRLVAAALQGGAGLRRLRKRPPADPPAPPPAIDRDRAPSALRYQARRDINVERLARADLLLAQSRRVKEIYARLGVPAEKLRVMQLTLEHLAGLRPRTRTAPPACIHFVTLNGCASVEKGSEVILAALESLHEAGMTGRFAFTALGHASPETQHRLRQLPGAQYGGGYDISTLDETLSPFDVGIVPSVWEEAYGYTGVELLAKGIPVIGNRRGGIVDYTRDGQTGWVNADASAAGLAKIMAELIAEPERVLQMHQQVVAQHDTLILTMPDHARAIDEVYGELVAASRRRESALAQAAGP